MARGGDDVVRVKVVAGPFPATLVVWSQPTQQTPFDLSKKRFAGVPTARTPEGFTLSERLTEDQCNLEKRVA